MLIDLDYGLVQLSSRQDIELFDGVGISITCISGSIWITQHQDNADIVLGAGDSFILDRPGLAIVHALTASSARLVEPQRAVSGQSRVYFTQSGQRFHGKLHTHSMPGSTVGA
jgi:hypothetical protein